MMSVPFSPKENSVPNRTELCLLQFSVCLLLFLNMNEWRLARYMCFASAEDGIVLAWGTSLQIVVNNYVLFSDIKGLGNVECFKWCFNPIRFFVQTSDTTSFCVCVCICWCADMKCLPKHSPPHFWDRSLIEPGIYQFGQICWPVSSRDLVMPVSLESWEHLPECPAFDVNTGDWIGTQVYLCAWMAGTLLNEPSPKVWAGVPWSVLKYSKCSSNRPGRTGVVLEMVAGLR